jgi:hypothetical protein
VVAMTSESTQPGDLEAYARLMRDEVPVRER